MPEMPEVETVVRSLRKKLIGHKIIAAHSIENKDNVIIYPEKEKFLTGICDKTVKDIRRRGKYIILLLSGGYKLVVHLRMTGKLLYISPGELQEEERRQLQRFACVEFALDGDKTLLYTDIRRFGTLYLVKEEETDLIKGLVQLGPEPLSEEFSAEYLREAMKHKQVAVKTFLLDQTKVAGLGNIYVDEALALAGINPQRRAGEINPEETERLRDAVNQVIAQGIKDGGTSFRDYRDADNKKGSHQDHLLVFQRTGKPCLRCHTPIEKIKLNGRGTHFCPKCQPMKKR